MCTSDDEQGINKLRPNGITVAIDIFHLNLFALKISEPNLLAMALMMTQLIKVKKKA